MVVLGRHQHQPCIGGVWNFAGFQLGGMHPSKAASLSSFLAEKFVEFSEKLSVFTQVALLVVLRGAVEVGCGANPVAIAIALDESAVIPQAAQRITENTD